MSKLHSVIVGLAGLGLIDTIYLSYKHATSSDLICNFLDGCNVVTTSVYSKLFGVIPLAYLGLAFYLFLLFVIFAKVRAGKFTTEKILKNLISVGFAFSLYYLYLQVFVIKALCIYCLVSLTINALMFVAIVVNCLRSRKHA